MSEPTTTAPCPLERLVARALGCGRSQARRLIATGRIRSARGERFDDPGQPMAAGSEVRLDDQPLRLVLSHHVVMHKPIGVVSTRADPHHPSAWDLVADQPLAHALRPVGRLDLDCAGLLPWTTEGRLIQWAMHPKRALPRTYHLALAGPWRPCSGPVVLADGTAVSLRELAPLAAEEAHPALIVPPAATALARITIASGRYHEVKRCMAALGTRVLALARVGLGPLDLPRSLAPGRSWACDLPALLGAPGGAAWPAPGPGGRAPGSLDPTRDDGRR